MYYDTDFDLYVNVLTIDEESERLEKIKEVLRKYKVSEKVIKEAEIAASQLGSLHSTV